MNLAKFPFAGVPVTPTSPVELFDSRCRSLGVFDQVGTITIASDGAVSYTPDEPGQGDTAEEIAWHQKRNAKARKSHTKTTRKKLRRLGIKLTEIRRCQWPRTST